MTHKSAIQDSPLTFNYRYCHGEIDGIMIEVSCNEVDGYCALLNYDFHSTTVRWLNWGDAIEISSFTYTSDPFEILQLVRDKFRIAWELTLLDEDYFSETEEAELAEAILAEVAVEPENPSFLQDVTDLVKKYRSWTSPM